MNKLKTAVLAALLFFGLSLPVLAADNFTPIGNTVGIASQGATSSSATSINVPSGWTGGVDVLVTNDTDKTIFIKFGSSAVTAAVATADMPVKSGAIMVFGVGTSTTHITAITASGTATGSIYFTPGKGQ